MKKVLFTATVDSHILQFHLPFLKMFKDNGYEVHVATNGNEEIPFCDVKHVISFERSPFKLNNIKAIHQLKKIINFEKFDIIHTHTPMGSVVTRLAARKARKKYNTRLIYTAHGFHFFKGAPIKNWLLFYPVEKWLSKYTDTLILINQEDYNLAKNKFSKRCKDIQYVPGVGIDENKFNFYLKNIEKDKLRASFNIKPNDFIMIYPAELSNRKRQLWLIETLSNYMKEHNDIHLLLPGKDSLDGKCQSLVKQLNLNDQIHFLGYRKDIPNLLKISNISISTANQEGLPVNIMEAMYLGLPIVASNCRGNRDLVIDSKNGYLVDLDDKKRFVDCINKLYLDRVNDFFGNNSKKIIKDYLLDIVAEKMNTIYFDKKIKICHFVSGLQSGGAEAFLINYFSKIDLNKYELHVLYQHKPVLKSLKEFESLGFIIKRIPAKKKRPIGNIIQTYYYLKNNKIDVVHTHMTLANFVPLMAAKFAKVPIRICHAHSCNNSDINIIKKIINNKLKKLNMKYSTYKIACGLKAGQYMYGDYKYKLIPNAINIEKYSYSQTNRNNIRNHFKIKDDCILIGHIGSFSTTKNHDFLIELIKSLPNNKYKLMLIGDGKLYNQIKNRVKNENLENRVIFVGVIDNPEVYYSAFDLFVLPSLWEGLPMVCIEAQANGVRCIISNNVDDSCKVNENVSFLKLDIDEWIDYIQSLDRKSLKRIDNKDISNSCYNIEKAVDELEKIYDKEVL